MVVTTAQEIVIHVIIPLIMEILSHRGTLFLASQALHSYRLGAIIWLFGKLNAAAKII